jgi:hypothetical protein
MDFIHRGSYRRESFPSYNAALDLWEGSLTLPDNSLEAMGEAQREHLTREALRVRRLRAHEIDFVFYLIKNHNLIKDTQEMLNKVLLPSDQASRVISIIGGILYVVIRLILLSLAFSALRSVPEGVYTTTWVETLPNIS